MRIDVGDGSISFTTEAGTEKVSVATLTDIDGDTDHGYLLGQLGLIGMACFFQLSKLNHIFGSIDLEAKEGHGLLGMVGQQTISLTEISALLGRLTTELELMKEQAGQPIDTEKIMKQALATAKEAMGQFNPTPMHTNVSSIRPEG